MSSTAKICMLQRILKAFFCIEECGWGGWQTGIRKLLMVTFQVKGGDAEGDASIPSKEKDAV